MRGFCIKLKSKEKIKCSERNLDQFMINLWSNDGCIRPTKILLKNSTRDKLTIFYKQNTSVFVGKAAGCAK